MPAADSGECTSRTTRIACAFAVAADLGKPIVVGEVGITATDAAARRRRADLLQAKGEAAFRAGAEGYLVWHYGTAQTDGYDIVRTDNDPTFGVVRRLAAEFGTGD